MAKKKRATYKDRIASGELKANLNRLKEQNKISSPCQVVIKSCKDCRYWYAGMEGTIYDVEIVKYKGYARTLQPYNEAKQWIKGAIFEQDFEILK